MADKEEKAPKGEKAPKAEKAPAGDKAPNPKAERAAKAKADAAAKAAAPKGEREPEPKDPARLQRHFDNVVREKMTKQFGYQTFWVTLLGAPMEELGVVPDGTGKDLTNLVGYLKA